MVQILNGVLYNFLKVEKNKCENIDFVVSFFIMRISKTLGCIYEFYISNNSSANGDVSFLL